MHSCCYSDTYKIAIIGFHLHVYITLYCDEAAIFNMFMYNYKGFIPVASTTNIELKGDLPSSKLQVNSHVHVHVICIYVHVTVQYLFVDVLF